LPFFDTLTPCCHAAISLSLPISPFHAAADISLGCHIIDDFTPLPLTLFIDFADIIFAAFIDYFDISPLFHAAALPTLFDADAYADAITLIRPPCFAAAAYAAPLFRHAAAYADAADPLMPLPF
jgi:hypothetical protein